MNSATNISLTAAQVRRIILALPTKIGDMAVLFSKQRFREQAWADNTTQPWKRRKARNRGSAGRAILVKSGRLRRSIRIFRSSTDSVTIGSDVPYASAHNEGVYGTIQVGSHSRTKWKKERVGTGTYSIRSKKERMKTVTSAGGSYTVKAHSRQAKLPRRRYMGKSAALDRQIKRLITSQLMKPFK